MTAFVLLAPFHRSTRLFLGPQGTRGMGFLQEIDYGVSSSLVLARRSLLDFFLFPS